MANYKEILRLHSLGINNTRIAESCGCARSTVISTLQRADTLGINWSNIQGLSEQDVSKNCIRAQLRVGSTACRITSRSTRRCRRAA